MNPITASTLRPDTDDAEAATRPRMTRKESKKYPRNPWAAEPPSVQSVSGRTAFETEAHFRDGGMA